MFKLIRLMIMRKLNNLLLKEIKSKEKDIGNK